MNWKLTLLGILVFFYYYSFQYHYEFSTFSPFVFLGMLFRSMQRKFKRSTNKHLQAPTVPSTKIFGCETITFRWRIVITPLMHKIFRYQKLLEKQKGITRPKVLTNVIPPLSIVFWYQKLSETQKKPSRNLQRQTFFEISCDTSIYGFMVNQIFWHPTNGQHQKFTETPETSRNT